MLKPLLAAALALLATAASADQTAIYAQGGGSGQRLTVEVADSGAARIESGRPDEYGVLRDGVFYLVGREGGKWRVSRLTDVAAAFDQVIGPFFKSLFAPLAEAPAKPSRLKIVKRGTRTVGGVTGDVYAVTGLDETKPAEATDFVISADPRLAPVGRAFTAFIESTMLLAAPFLGNQVGAMIAESRSLAALGTPISAGGRFELVSVKEGPIDPSRFALPATPLTVEQIVAEMKKNAPPR